MRISNPRPRNTYTDAGGRVWEEPTVAEMAEIAAGRRPGPPKEALEAFAAARLAGIDRLVALDIPVDPPAELARSLEDRFGPDGWPPAVGSDVVDHRGRVGRVVGHKQSASGPHVAALLVQVDGVGEVWDHGYFDGGLAWPCVALDRDGGTFRLEVGDVYTIAYAWSSEPAERCETVWKSLARAHRAGIRGEVTVLPSGAWETDPV